MTAVFAIVLFLYLIWYYDIARPASGLVVIDKTWLPHGGYTICADYEVIQQVDIHITQVGNNFSGQEDIFIWGGAWCVGVVVGNEKVAWTAIKHGFCYFS